MRAIGQHATARGRDRAIDAQFPDVLLMARQPGNRERAPLAMALQHSTNPRNASCDRAIARNTQTSDPPINTPEIGWISPREK
jgi:hypothetical protein